MNAIDVFRAATVIAPLVQDVLGWISGGAEPDWVRKLDGELPKTLRSRAALELNRARLGK